MAGFKLLHSAVHFSYLIDRSSLDASVFAYPLKSNCPNIKYDTARQPQVRWIKQLK